MQDNKDWTSITLLDRSVLDQLCEALEEDAADILDAYLGDTPEIADNLGTALDRGDYEEAAGFAHQLISSSGALGGMRVQALARHLEEQVKQGQHDNLTADGRLLLDSIEEYLQLLRDYRTERQI